MDSGYHATPKVECRRDSPWKLSIDKNHHYLFSPDFYFNGLNFRVRFFLDKPNFAPTSQFSWSLHAHPPTPFFFYDPPAVFFTIKVRSQIFGSVASGDLNLTARTGAQIGSPKSLYAVESDGKVVLNLDLSCNAAAELLPRPIISEDKTPISSLLELLIDG